MKMYGTLCLTESYGDWAAYVQSVHPAGYGGMYSEMTVPAAP